jgi:aminomethyltransferase
MKLTVLHAEHVALKAKMALFGGFDMPIQYEGGILKEHHACRTGVAIFDTCHMGEFLISGPTALADLENLLSCDLGDLAIGKCRYGLLCNIKGGVVDDQILYRLGEQDYMMVVNAGTQDFDFHWVRNHLSATTKIENVSDQTAKLDIQGPLAIKLCQKLFDQPLTPMVFYSFGYNVFQGTKVLVSRTGYTGEPGIEVYCPAELGVAIWRKAIELGAVPAGLGARDTLRLEVAYPLYGHEMNEETPAAASGFTKSISTTKRFVGCDAVRVPPTIKLVGLELADRRAARNGMDVLNEAGAKVGIIASGSFCPTIEKSVAFAYIKAEAATPGTKLQVATGRTNLPATIVPTPFYTGAKGRAKWETIA